MKADAKDLDFCSSGAHRLTTPASSPDDMRDLLSKIERKLSCCADARQDMQSLRDLLSSQLLNATALQATNYPPSHLSRETNC
jgi:hypothetical protein